MFKIGYFFHMPTMDISNEELVLLLFENVFCFKLVETGIIPSEYRRLNDKYYNLSMPVICYVNNGSNHVNSITFVNDIPISPNNTTSEGFSIQVNEDKSPTLLYNGQEFVDNNFSFPKEKQLATLIIEQVVSKRMISGLQFETRKITPTCSTRDKQKIIDAFIHQIESYNLKDILSSLHISVWDYHKSKVGGDDTYKVYKNVELLDKSQELDPYLEHLIGIGEHCIVDERAYTSYFPRPNIPFGDYEGRDLEEEKQQIVSNYSKEEHLGFLFFEQLEKQKKAAEELPNWTSILKETETKLKQEFIIDKLSSLEQRFFYNSLHGFEDHTDSLKSLNEYLMRVQSSLPEHSVVITGNIPFVDPADKDRYDISSGMPMNDSRYYSLIGDAIDELSKHYKLKLVTGNANGAEALALRYAMSKKIEFINEYVEWTMLGKDESLERNYEMVKLADAILVTGDLDYYITKNFIKVAKELNKPIRKISFDRQLAIL